MQMVIDSDNAEKLIRERVATLLLGGLQTQWRQRAYGSEAINELTGRLRALKPDDYAAKLTLAGFTSQPYQSNHEDIAQACQTCMYYAINRKFCELPELNMPVDTEWSCVLWRI